MKFKILISLVILTFIKSSLIADDLEDCRQIADVIEKKINIPNKLLSSISITESGYFKNGNFAPWPWTLNINGKSKFFDTKQEMTIFLNQKLSENIKNIDIGCMQINYKYHSMNFKKIDDMINPELNVQYAGIFLKKLFKKYRSWNKAISFYHSSDPLRMKKYLIKVKKNWDLERQRKNFKENKSILSNIDDSRRKKILFFKQKLEKEKPYFM